MKNSLLDDCEQLLREIISDAPPEHEYILATVVKANQFGKVPLPARSTFPNFYGYMNDGTKHHLMLRIKVSSNVPNGARALMTSRDLVHQEEILNLPSQVKSYNDKLNDIAMAKYAWTRNSTKYSNAELIVIFRSKAEEWLKQRETEAAKIKLPEQRDYWYENEQLSLRLTNGAIDQLDFSKAKVSRKMFETFWDLWKSKSSGEYSPSEVCSRYKELFHEDLSPGRIGRIVANIRDKIIKPKRLIKDRIVWSNNRSKVSSKWIFRIK